MVFDVFRERWLESLTHLLRQLKVAPKATTAQNNQPLQRLLNRVMSHFSEYYRVKSLAAHYDVLALIESPWSSSVEGSLHWVAGWRPTTAFHLIHSQSASAVESRVMQILEGVHTGDLGELSVDQLTRVSELQCETLREENAITEEMAEWEERGLSEFLEDGVQLRERLQGLVRVVVRANDLRSRTVQRVVELLSPQQAVEFLVAAIELQFGIHVVGFRHDRKWGIV